MFSTLLMGGGGHAREKDHQNVKSLIIFARDCSSQSLLRHFGPIFTFKTAITPRLFKESKNCLKVLYAVFSTLSDD